MLSLTRKSNKYAVADQNTRNEFIHQAIEMVRYGDFFYPQAAAIFALMRSVGYSHEESANTASRYNNSYASAMGLPEFLANTNVSTESFHKVARFIASQAR